MSHPKRNMEDIGIRVDLQALSFSPLSSRQEAWQMKADVGLVKQLRVLHLVVKANRRLPLLHWVKAHPHNGILPQIRPHLIIVLPIGQVYSNHKSDTA